MLLKILTAATAGALLMLSPASFAQSQPSGSGVAGSGERDAPSTDITAKCAAMVGAEREKCLREANSGAAGGAYTGGTSSTTPASPSTPSGKGSGSTGSGSTGTKK